MNCIYDDGKCAQVTTRGMCQMHYMRVYKYGDPHYRGKNPRDRGTSYERWAAKYEFAPDGCWNWTAYVAKNGYGRFKASDLPFSEAHRAAWHFLVGPIPEGMELDHLCKNRRCVNPAHLEPVTHSENVQRSDAGIRNKEKTHCKHGHEFTPENTITTKSGRNCRTCNRKIVRESQRRLRARNAAARTA